MSTPAKAVPEPSACNVGFTELVERYVHDYQPPDTPWLTQLELDEPRVNVYSLSSRYRFWKRTIDIVGSLSLGLLLAPLWLVIPVLIKLTGGSGPTIYKQTRVGLNSRDKQKNRRRSNTGEIYENDRRVGSPNRRNENSFGKLFTIYKFRTMRNDAEQQGAQFAQQNDSRVTALGKFMRKTRIDEIPQLVNVLRGEMSLVGPRPERPVFVDQLSKEIPYYLDRLGLQPGLTGIAQIENGYDNDVESFRRKVAYDLQYLQNCSIGNDLKILLRTITVVLTGKGAL